jgi:hypothetical protein
MASESVATPSTEERALRKISAAMAAVRLVRDKLEDDPRNELSDALDGAVMHMDAAYMLLAEGAHEQ